MLIVGSVLAAVSVGALWLAASALSAPVRTVSSAPPEDLRVERVTFPSDSGATIAAWYGAAAPGQPTVVLSHGVRGSRSQLSDRALFLRRAGFGALIYDAQAHGESTGDQITYGYLEAHDSFAAVSYVREHNPGGSVGFIGPSLAGASALLGPKPLPVDALVLEAVYPTLEQAVVNRIAIRVGPVSAPLLAKLLLWQVEPRLGFDPYQLNPIDRIPNVDAPILLIAGADDRHTTLAESRALYAAAPEPKELWVVHGATHESFHRHAPREYERRILEFLRRHLPPGSA